MCIPHQKFLHTAVMFWQPTPSCFVGQEKIPSSSPPKTVTYHKGNSHHPHHNHHHHITIITTPSQNCHLLLDFCEELMQTMMEGVRGTHANFRLNILKRPIGRNHKCRTIGFGSQRRWTKTSQLDFSRCLSSTQMSRHRVLGELIIHMTNYLAKLEIEFKCVRRVLFFGVEVLGFKGGNIYLQWKFSPGQNYNKRVEIFLRSNTEILCEVFPIKEGWSIILLQICPPHKIVSL